MSRAIKLGEDGLQAIQARADALAKERRKAAEKTIKARKRKQRRAARKARRGVCHS